MSLESIRALVYDDLQATDHFIISQLDSNIPLIKQVLEYVLSCGGKRIRPLVLLLSAKALHYSNHHHINLAAVIELIHTATLLHDDVVDSSTLRRGNKTAHTIWGSNSSVLVGDYLYSRAFQIVVDLKHQTILEIFAKATHYIAEGEILQLVNCNNPDTTESFYFEIIQRKTAKLFEVATQLGALLATNNDQTVALLKQFGLHLGLAYQLIDDALDYGTSSDLMGKNIGQDISDGKTTLPLIYAMQKSKNADLDLLRYAITTGSNKNLENILSIIESTNAIEYTVQAAKKQVKEAQNLLDHLPKSPYQKALHDISNFIAERMY